MHVPVQMQTLICKVKIILSSTEILETYRLLEGISLSRCLKYSSYMF
jgi:hypothetical protein